MSDGQSHRGDRDDPSVLGVATSVGGGAGDGEAHRAALEVRILTAIVAKEARQAVEQRLKAYGVEITSLQYRVLRQLEQRRSTIKALSQALLVDPASVVPVINTLTRHDFVLRERDPHDRRRIPLVLTEAGRDYLAQSRLAASCLMAGGFLRSS
jgi:MarR family transcriptional regulator for hemolysin